MMIHLLLNTGGPRIPDQNGDFSAKTILIALLLVSATWVNLSSFTIVEARPWVHDTFFMLDSTDHAHKD